MENLENINLIIGFVAPLVISVIIQPGFSNKARVAVMVAFSILAGFATSYFAGELNGLDITTAIITVAVTAIATYKGVFQPLGVSPWLVDKVSATKTEAIEAPVSPVKYVEDKLPTRAEARALREARAREDSLKGTGKHRKESGEA